jgi:anti-sigma-K factor RskA
MKPGIDKSSISRNEAFDRDMRQLHASAMVNISPQTLARLRAARQGAQRAPQRGHAWRWAVASAFSAVLAVAIGVQFLPSSTPAPAAQPMATATGNSSYVDSLSALDENPDLYLWLASSEADPLAME